MRCTGSVPNQRAYYYNKYSTIKDLEDLEAAGVEPFERVVVNG